MMSNGRPLGRELRIFRFSYIRFCKPVRYTAVSVTNPKHDNMELILCVYVKMKQSPAEMTYTQRLLQCAYF